MPQMRDFMLCELSEKEIELENIHSLHFKGLYELDLNINTPAYIAITAMAITIAVGATAAVAAAAASNDPIKSLNIILLPVEQIPSPI